MSRYMIIAPHTDAECSAIVNQVITAGFNTHVDWGCKDGDHTGWAIIEADSHEQALMFVPPIMRPNAKAVRVVKFYEAGKKPHEKL
jgi:hypothetical protein